MSEKIQQKINILKENASKGRNLLLNKFNKEYKKNKNKTLVITGSLIAAPVLLTFVFFGGSSLSKEEFINYMGSDFPYGQRFSFSEVNQNYQNPRYETYSLTKDGAEKVVKGTTVDRLTGKKFDDRNEYYAHYVTVNKDEFVVQHPYYGEGMPVNQYIDSVKVLTNIDLNGAIYPFGYEVKTSPSILMQNVDDVNYYFAWDNEIGKVRLFIQDMNGIVKERQLSFANNHLEAATEDELKS